MTEKTITVNGKEVKFKASAALPRMYRNMFGRDMFKDMETFERLIKGIEPEEDQFMNEIFENVAYSMAKHADPDVPEAIEDWLEQFDVRFIYEVAEDILRLWYNNMRTDITAKKKRGRQSEK